MSGIKMNKMGDFEHLRAARGAEAKRAETTSLHAGEAKQKEQVKEDKIEVSGKAATVKKLVEKVENLPDVRQERVNELKDRIAAGTYNPSSKDIADAILKDEK